MQSAVRLSPVRPVLPHPAPVKVTTHTLRGLQVWGAEPPDSAGLALPGPQGEVT